MDTNEQEASAQQPAPEKPSWHIPHGPGRFLLGVGPVLFAMSADGLPAPIRTFSLVAGGWLLFGMIWARARDDAADRDEQFSQRIWGVMEVHGETLRRKRLQLEHVDDYGNVFMDAWEAEKGYFIANVVLPALGKAELLPREAGRLDELIELVAQPPRGGGGD